MLDDARIDSFVVKNGGYYRAKWQRFHDKPGAIASFNGAACIGQPIWLVYRKLYVPLLWYVAMVIADVSIFLYVQESQLASANLITVWNSFVAVLSLAIFGYFGNYWYFT